MVREAACSCLELLTVSSEDESAPKSRVLALLHSARSRLSPTGFPTGSTVGARMYHQASQGAHVERAIAEALEKRSSCCSGEAQAGLGKKGYFYRWVASQ